MRFSFAPRDLDVYDGGTGRSLGVCQGFRSATAPPCEEGYATVDIYYLEVCLLNQICTNGPELFNLETGQFFVCEFDSARYGVIR
jgi:hypothetical protein